MWWAPLIVIHAMQQAAAQKAHDQCDTPQFWQMIRDRADKLPAHSEWRMPNLSDAWALAFH